MGKAKRTQFIKPSITTGDNIIVVEFHNHNLPKFVEKRNKDWVFYGEDNAYPDYLLWLYENSGKHAVLINGKVDYIVGKGFEVDKTGLTTGRQAEIKSFIDNINPKENATDVLRKTATDLEIFNGFALECIGNKKKTRISQVYHVDFSKIRVGKDKANPKFYYSEDWTCYKQDESTGFKELLPYDSKTKSGLIYYVTYRPKLKDYPHPSYLASIKYIEIDAEIGNFHLSNIKNGFTAGTLISFNNGEPPTQEEQKTLENKIKDKFTGTGNAGKFILTFSDGTAKAPTVNNLQSNGFDKLFKELNKTTEQEIFTGHRITSPMLFGIKTEGQLGGRQELIDSFELFQNGYIDSKQDIHTRIFNFIASENGFEQRLSIVKTEPIGYQFSEQTLVGVMTRDEIREKAGLPKLVPAQMKKEDPLKAFEKFGRSKKGYKVIDTKEVHFHSSEDAILSEIAFHREAFKYIPNISANDRKILDLVKKNPDISLKQIADFLEEDDAYVLSRVKNLIKRDLLKGEPGKDLSITDDGGDTIDQDPPTAESVEIMYSYEVRDGVGPEVIETTRDFCRKLIELDKYYSRQDIEQISERVGRDVWAERGGFYHDPGSDVTTPYCRHIWRQNIVRKKNG